MWFLMFCVGINIGIHRYFSHRSFKASTFSQWFMLTCFNLSTVGSSMAWVGMHREHHAFSDTDKDPHSPITAGTKSEKIKKSLAVYFGVWKKYIAHPKYIGKLRREPLHKWAHNYYLVTIFAYATLLSFFGTEALVYGYCLPAVLVFHSASFIVVYGHIFGSQDQKTNDHSKNSVLLHWITWGEGLHNFHHAYPSRHRHKNVPWYFYDLPGAIIDNFLASNK